MTGGAKSLPCVFRCRDGLDADGLSEIVRASDRNDKSWNLLMRKAPKMTVYGAVAAKNQDSLRLIGRIEFVAREKIHALQFEGADVTFFSVRSQQSNSAHRATFA